MLGVEQRGLGEQVAEDGGAAGGEEVVGDVGVLAAYVGDVLRVALGRRGQDREVGVGEHAAVRVVGLGPVVLGEADQPGHLVGLGPAGECGERPLRGAFLGAGLAVVHAVVEPRGQPHGGGVEVLAGRLELVDAVEHLGEVAGVVVAAAGGVRRRKLVADLRQLVAERPAHHVAVLVSTMR